MRQFARRLLASLTVVALICASVPARAQEDAPPPAPPPPPSSARSGNGEYVAPLAQQTQRTYVPQSVALSGPRFITDWKPGDPIPDGYRVETRARVGAIVGGAVTFGVLYLLSAFVASVAADASNTTTYGPNGVTTTKGSNPDGALYVPAIGPFIQMGNTSSATGNFALVIDGAAQTLGLVLLIYGITSPRTLLVRNDLANTRIVPMAMGKGGYGLGLHVQF